MSRVSEKSTEDTCTHIAAEHARFPSTPCIPCDECRAHIDADGKLMDRKTALSRYPEFRDSIRANEARWRKRPTVGGTIRGLWQLVIAVGGLVVIGAIVYAIASASSSGQATPTLSDQRCEVDPFNGAYRATGGVHNSGKTGEVSVRGKAELFGGETKEGVDRLGTMHPGQNKRYLVTIAVPEGANVIACSAIAVSF